MVWVWDQIGRLFGDGTDGTGLAQLKTWSRKMGLRGLADMGVTEPELDDIAPASAGASSLKGNPFLLSQPAPVSYTLVTLPTTNSP